MMTRQLALGLAKGTAGLFLVAVLSGCASPKNISLKSAPATSSNGPIYDVSLDLTNTPILNGLKQITQLKLRYRNNSSFSVRFTIEKYSVMEVDITSNAKDRSPLCRSLDNYIDPLRKNGQRMQPGFSSWHSWDYDTFILRAGEVHNDTATYHANQVGIFQLQALADLKFPDGRVEHLASNKVEVAVLPIQEFASPN